MRYIIIILILVLAGCATIECEDTCGDGFCSLDSDEGCPSETDISCPEDCPTGSDLARCERPTDCIPLPSDCHPMSCINAEFKGNFEPPEVCTEIFLSEAAYTPKDCGCVDGTCINLNK